MKKDNFSHVTHYTEVNVQPGSILIEHVENLYQADWQKMFGKDFKQSKSETPSGQLPAVLNTPEAQRLLAICRDKDWLDDSNHPTISNNRAAVLAFVLANQLELEPRWAPFEQFWGIKDMANCLSHANLNRYYPELYKKFTQTLQDTSEF